MIRDYNEFLNDININRGAHTSWENGHCALEVCSYMAGELKISDHPACVSSAIAGFVRSWNDALPSDEERNRLLKDLLPLLLNTRGNDRLELRRVFYILDWEIRIRTPAFLRAAGLENHATELENFPEIVNLTSLKAAEEKCSAARSAAYSAAYSAAGSAACSAACSAARYAAYSAAYSAAGSAADSAAGSAADSAACSAACSAARSAAYSAAYFAADKLQETVSFVQQSARDLIRRMCALTEADVPNDWTWD